MSKFAVFIGAGASAPFGIPTMTKMAEEFEVKLRASHLQYLEFFDVIKSRLRDYKGFDIEALITVLENILRIEKMPATVLNHPSIHYFLAEQAGGIGRAFEYEKWLAETKRDAANELLGLVKGFIADCCVMKKQPFEIYGEFFHHVMFKHGYNFRQAIQAGEAKGVNCIIFTTNYDLVLEGYCRSRSLDYECGQIQNQELDISNEGNSRLYSPEALLFQIHKLHGSINWYRDERGRMRWLTEATRPGKTTLLGDQVVKELLIYPAFEKYTFREPFYTMFHYLKNTLGHCDACYVVGYSFRDDDILGLFHDSMELNNKLELYIIDMNAPKIAKEKFQDLMGRVHQIPMEFSVQAARNLA